LVRIILAQALATLIVTLPEPATAVMASPATGTCAGDQAAVSFQFLVPLNVAITIAAIYLDLPFLTITAIDYKITFYL
jgi:hypothetical protein